MGNFSEIIDKIKKASDEQTKILVEEEDICKKQYEQEKPEQDEIISRIKALNNALNPIALPKDGMWDTKFFWRGTDPIKKTIRRLTLVAMANELKIVEEYPLLNQSRLSGVWNVIDYQDLDLDQLRSLDKRLSNFAGKILELKEKQLKHSKEILKKEKSKDGWQFWKR